MSLSPSPYLFSLFWLLESFGVAVVSTAVYWGSGYGVYQATNNFGYYLGAFMSGYLPGPFIYAVLPLAALSAALIACKDL